MSLVAAAHPKIRQYGEDAAMAARLARDLPGFLHRPAGAEQATDHVRQRLANRERLFLTLVERAIYGHARSPFIQLLRHAGCELGDVATLTRREGIEGALRALADQGVYVTFDELKGRRDAVRGSQRFSFRPEEFESPRLRPHLAKYSGGSGGRPSRVRYPLRFLEEWGTSLAAVFNAHGISHPRVAFWSPVPLHWLIGTAWLGYPATGWFYPSHPLPRRVIILARYLHLLARMAGHRLPLPQHGSLDLLLDWCAEQQRTPGDVVVTAMASAATRLAIAAREAGQRLDNITFLLLGEPVTEARRGHIEAAGARLIVNYSSNEVLGLAHSCAAPMAADDVHVMVDRFALVHRPRAVDPDGLLVDSLLVTSLSDTAGTIVFNYELGDYGRLEERDCGCHLGALGLRTHLSEIRSFEKLTGEGVTFARSNLEQILEQTLPSRFGGTSVDFQLAEEEAPSGTARLILRVSPALGAVDEDALIATLLAELGREGIGERYHAGMWRQTGTVEVRRETPRATRAGKVLPFQPLGSTERTTVSRS